MENFLTFSDLAKKKIKSLMLEQDSQDLKLRVFVQGGGCSGFKYGFTFEEQSSDDDFIVNLEDFLVLIDHVSAQYLSGAFVDYEESLVNSQFVFKNPNAITHCGCGSSFKTSD